MKKLTYIIVALVVLLVFVRHFKPSDEPTEFDIESFAELPVQEGGRIKPLDSSARNTLLILAGQQKVITPEGETLAPIEWFMDLTMRPQKADTYRVFKIEFPDELGLSGLSETGERRYAFNDLRPHFEEIRRLYSEINSDPEERGPYEEQIAKLNNNLMRYHRAMHALHPIGSPERLDNLVDEYRDYMRMIPRGLEELGKQQADEDYDAELLNRFVRYGDDYLQLSRTAELRIIPPPPPADPLDDWKNVGTGLLDAMKDGELNPYIEDYAALTMAYRAGDAETFNAKVDEMRERFKSVFPEAVGRVHFEHFFNTVQPFYLSMQLYVAVFLIACLSWLYEPRAMSRCAFWVLILAFLIHTFGLVARMYIQGRPPVTNLYSSAIFVGWGAVLLGVFIERFSRNGLGAAMAALIGFCTLIVAHHLSMSGDTLEMMQAVLDSNFWLATHVIVITFGYSAMFLAGALALIFVVLGVFSRGFDQNTAKSLNSMVYGVTCFAALFSLVGTILGGIWADQSWGRFWGWDPKENGALLIVLMTAVFLHARWGGLVRERGLMALALCGNIVTSWSWFGTNMLGKGLHSYGFTDSGVKWLTIFITFQLIFIATALLPWRYWRSNFGREKHLRERKRILMAAEDA
ncbi:MAG: cytochrome c biogenesis protein [Opitutales bacterium]